MFKFISKLFGNNPKHNWSTTHTNKWYHPTRQVDLRSGLSRRFEYFRPELPDDVKIERKIKCCSGMPWLMGRWVWSNGKQSEYDVLD